MPEPLGTPPAAPPPPPLTAQPSPRTTEGSRGAPPNLPTTEPVDIFAGVKEATVAAGAPAAAVPPIGEQAARGGLGKKLLLIGGIAVLVVIIGIVVWLIFRNRESGIGNQESRGAPAAETPAPAPEPEPSSVPAPAPTPEPPTPAGGGIPTPSDAGVGTEPVTPAADTDGDGLSDAEEEQLGTNPQSADTDADGLSDRDETKVYQTDPLNKDTDGDTFPDGSEVRKGYNPKGAGLLFEVPPAQ